MLGTLNIGAFFYLLFVAAYHLPGGTASLVGPTQTSPLFEEAGLSAANDG